MKLEVHNINGESTGKSVDLSDDIFGQEPNEHAVYLAVKQYLANQRQGNHKAKERGEITGSTRKIKKQKGTGTARAGSIKNPLFRKGGRVFGPRVRDYGFKLNKKTKQLARRSALSAKATAGSVKVVEDFTFDAPKTSEFIQILKNFDTMGRPALLVTADYDKTLHLSSRNVNKSNVVKYSDLNTYHIMNSWHILISESAVAKMHEQF